MEKHSSCREKNVVANLKNQSLKDSTGQKSASVRAINPSLHVKKELTVQFNYCS